MTPTAGPDDGPLTAGASLASASSLTWCEQDRSLGAAEDLDYSVTLLRAVQSGALSGPVVRVYRPEPTVSFGQRDVRLHGYPDAVRACAEHGFAPVVRRAGGRAAAYHHGSIVVDHLDAAPDAMIGSRARFQDFAAAYRKVLRAAGVDAEVGEVPGEYCPGEYSIHARRAGAGPVKVIGTAQRAVSGAWLFSSSWVIEDPEPIRAVLTAVYAALGLDWDPETAGSAHPAPLAGAARGQVTVEAVLEQLRQDTAPDRQIHFAELLAQAPADSEHEA